MDDLQLDFLFDLGGHAMTPLAIVCEQSIHCYSIRREQSAVVKRIPQGSQARSAQGRPLLLVVIPREVGQFWAFVNRLYFGDNLKWLSDRKEFPDPSIEGR
jgi:hypothetical protein